MEQHLDFINDGMPLDKQVEVWRKQYISLLNKSESDRKILKQYQHENERMNKSNKLSIKLVESLKKQIEKYQTNDNFDMNEENEAMDDWKMRYLTEKRTSQYLRAECEDLQNEIEELKENNNRSDNTANDDDEDKNNGLDEMLAIVNEAWEDEVASLIEKFQNNKTSKDDIRKSIDKKKRNIDYELLYYEAAQSKIELIQKTSLEIERLRKVIYDQNHTLYRNVFDRIVRYHNLEGGPQDTLYQLIVDADLTTKRNMNILNDE